MQEPSRPECRRRSAWRKAIRRGVPSLAPIRLRAREPGGLTHGMFIRKRLREWEPSSSFFINVHLDGLEKTHDLCVERDGVFREAIEGIKAAKAAGFLVC